jgi:tricorn protease
MVSASPYNQKSQVYWRKYYRGAYQSDIMIMDVASKKFTQVTDFDGLDSWPMWGRDGSIYFVSDRDGNGLTNIWRVSDSGGKADKVTSFKSWRRALAVDQFRRPRDRFRA